MDLRHAIRAALAAGVFAAAPGLQQGFSQYDLNHDGTLGRKPHSRGASK